MTENDLLFIRSQKSHNRPDIRRLLTLLVEAEARSDDLQHSIEKITLGYRHNCERCDWLFVNFIKAVKERWGLE